MTRITASEKSGEACTRNLKRCCPIGTISTLPSATARAEREKRQDERTRQGITAVRWKHLLVKVDQSADCDGDTVAYASADRARRPQQSAT